MLKNRIVKRLSLEFLSAVLLSAGMPLYALSAAPVQGPKAVIFQSEGETVHGVLFQPDGKGPFPAIIVIHEWWGLAPWVKQQARMFAGDGYVTLAVDLYRGHVTTDPEEAHELARALQPDRALADLEAADAYLKSQKFVRADRIGAVGWCMGGSFAMQFAVAEPTLRAVAINYGATETDLAQLKKIHAAILGNYGALDRGITPEDVTAFASEMQRIGHPVDVKEYPDAGHGFQNPINGQKYKPADTADADRRMVAFFRQNLKQ